MAKSHPEIKLQLHCDEFVGQLLADRLRLSINITIIMTNICLETLSKQAAKK